MPQLIRCPNAMCGTMMKVPDDAAGKKVKCPKCQQVFLVAAPAREAVGAAAPGRGAVGRDSTLPPSTSPRIVPTPPPAAAPPATNPSVCPACKAPLLPGAIACMDCGYLLQADGTGDIEGAPNLCANPA